MLQVCFVQTARTVSSPGRVRPAVLWSTLSPGRRRVSRFLARPASPDDVYRGFIGARARQTRPEAMLGAARRPVIGIMKRRWWPIRQPLVGRVMVLTGSGREV